MPELRKDPIIGRWVIIATERAKRPTDLQIPAETSKEGSFCPFCEGNEDKTPPEVLVYRKQGQTPNTPGWSLRVVPNKFPALHIEGGLNKRGDGMFDKMNGIGAHEVIIETPEHIKIMSVLSVGQIEDILWAYRDRILDLKKDKRFRYILIFKNQGIAAGASLEHTHSQIIALPIVPKRVAEELEGAKRYYEYKDRCVYCDIIQQELDSKVRLIKENRNFVSIAPFTPRFPFETWILPKSHDVYFEDVLKEDVEQLAIILKDTLMRIDITLGNPPYNFLIHNSPLHGKNNDCYHWHIEIIPKLTKVAGFEWGTGFYINPTPPEEAAQYMREANI